MKLKSWDSYTEQFTYFMNTWTLKETLMKDWKLNEDIVCIHFVYAHSISRSTFLCHTESSNDDWFVDCLIVNSVELKWVLFKYSVIDISMEKCIVMQTPSNDVIVSLFAVMRRTSLNAASDMLKHSFYFEMKLKLDIKNWIYASEIANLLFYCISVTNTVIESSA